MTATKSDMQDEGMVIPLPRHGPKPISLVPLFVLTCLAAGCTALEYGNMRTPREDMLYGIENWRNKASPEDQAVIDQVTSRQDTFFHVIPGDLSAEHTRGAGSFTATGSEAKKHCVFHPMIDGIKPWRNWDVVYDQKKEEEYARRTGITASFECSLQHEVLGHIALGLDDPEFLQRVMHNKKLKDENEKAAREIENRCRRRMDLPEVPPVEPSPRGK